MKGHTRREESKEPQPLLPSNIQSAKELKPGDRVVYPNQGVCKVVGLEQKDIAGQRLEMIRMTREEDAASVLVPMSKVSSVGLRRVSTPAEIESVFHFLAATTEDPELDWKVRHRDNVERLIAGGVLGVAEVVKGLHSLSRIRPLPAKEREQYDGARHLLVTEVAVALGVPGGFAEDYVDYALNPPAGTKFQLRPPPKPIAISVPFYRRKKPAPLAGDDLGLDELGLDLGALGGGGAAEAEEAAGPGEGAAGAAEEAGEAAAGAGPAPSARRARPAKPAGKRPPSRAAARKAGPKTGKRRPRAAKKRARKGTRGGKRK